MFYKILQFVYECDIMILHKLIDISPNSAYRQKKRVEISGVYVKNIMKG